MYDTNPHKIKPVAVVSSLTANGVEYTEGNQSPQELIDLIEQMDKIFTQIGGLYEPDINLICNIINKHSLAPIEERQPNYESPKNNTDGS